MTARPARSQMWHPSRGISFSPEPKRSPTTAPGSRPFGYSALAADNHKDDTLTSINKQNPEQAPIRSERKPPLEVTASYPVLPQADDALPTGNIADNVPLPVQVLEKKTTASDLLNVPYPALEYKMSEDLFRAAKKAIPGAPSSYWTYALYRGPKNDKPKIHYCRSKHTAERVCQEYFANEKLLGFDLEWAADSPKSAGPRRNVSLIQLASPSRIALFHVAAFPKGDDLVAPTFKKIMENPEVTKVGVWIKGDATRLRTHLDIDSKGLMELSHLYRLVTYSRTGEFGNINKRLIPLATQVEQYLHLPMFKGQDVRSSDWTQPLNMEQVTYSASDAYAGVQLFATLEHHREQLDPCPPTPHHAELNLPIRLADGLDLETDCEDEVSEPPPGDDPATPSILSPEARKRALIAHLKGFQSTASQITKTLRQAEDILDAVIARDARVEIAGNWAKVFIAENYPADYASKQTKDVPTDGFARFVELRAYHLWHTNKNLTTADVGALLRKPPLKNTTVATYISNAVKLEQLPVDDTRFNKEVLEAAIGKFTRYNKKPISSPAP